MWNKGAMKKTSVVTCPKCGASLSPDDDVRTVTCGYCQTSVQVDPDLASRGGAAPARNGKPVMTLAIVSAVLLVGVAAAIVVLTRSGPTPAPAPSSGAATPAETASESTKTPRSSAPSPPPSAAAAPAPDPAALADVVLEFGEKGNGPGQFEDARAMTVAPNGDIFVAEYQSLRIQRFDSSGKYLDTLALVAGEHGSVIPSLAATSDGHLWVTRGDDLLELALPEGKVVKALRSQTPHLAYGGIAVGPADVVYVENLGATTFVSIDGHGPPRSEDIRKLDKNGNLLAAWKDIAGESSLSGHIAVARDGTVYLAERRRRVDVIDAKGKVKARINALGEGGIAVDEKGRIFLGGSGHGITVFEAGGAKIGEIVMRDVEDIAIGQDGRLYALASRSRIRALTLR
jgi:hypothetical protein